PNDRFVHWFNNETRKFNDTVKGYCRKPGKMAFPVHKFTTFPSRQFLAADGLHPSFSGQGPGETQADIPSSPSAAMGTGVRARGEDEAPDGPRVEDWRTREKNSENREEKDLKETGGAGLRQTPTELHFEESKVKTKSIIKKALAQPRD
ncbi:hypothetical protein HPB47_018844, partial [Ixodes persulcatus]